MRSEDPEIILIFVSAAGVVLLMAMLIAFFVAIYQKRLFRQDQQLQQLETDFQKGLLQATIEGQERERKRLAKDLHDGIGSLLTGLNLNLKHQLHTVEAGTQQAAFLEEACKMLEEGIGDVRRVSHNLLPVTLENFGLVQALQEWMETVSRESFRVYLKVEGANRRMHTSLELGLFRVAQELLQNTLRHAEATEAILQLEFKKEEIRLNYSDNGKGYLVSALSRGIGIKNMQSRMEALNGTIEFITEPHQGFKACISVPLTPPQ